MVSFLAKAGSLRKIQIDTNYFYSGGPAVHGIQTFQPPVNRTLVMANIQMARELRSDLAADFLG
jgi:hypothetical protein